MKNKSEKVKKFQLIKHKFHRVSAILNLNTYLTPPTVRSVTPVSLIYM